MGIFTSISKSMLSFVFQYFAQYELNFAWKYHILIFLILFYFMFLEIKLNNIWLKCYGLISFCWFHSWTNKRFIKSFRSILINSFLFISQKGFLMIYCFLKTLPKKSIIYIFLAFHLPIFIFITKKDQGQKLSIRKQVKGVHKSEGLLSTHNKLLFY